MKKKVKKNVKSAFFEITPGMAIMVTCLLLGIAAGCVFAACAGNGVMANLVGEDIRRLSENGTYQYSFVKTFLNLVKYPVFAFLLAFCAYGILCIPAIVFFKGFTLSLSVSSIIGAFGKKGILTALSVFGVQSMVLIPCLIIITTLSFDCSKAFAFVIKTPRGYVSAKRPNFLYFTLAFVICIVLLFLAALADTALTPTLMSLSLKTIL